MSRLILSVQRFPDDSICLLALEGDRKPSKDFRNTVLSGRRGWQMEEPGRGTFVKKSMKARVLSLQPVNSPCFKLSFFAFTSTGGGAGTVVPASIHVVSGVQATH